MPENLTSTHINPSIAVNHLLQEENSELISFFENKTPFHNFVLQILKFYQDGNAIKSSLNHDNINDKVLSILETFNPYFTDFFKDEHQQIKPEYQEFLNNFLPTGKFISTLPLTLQSDSLELINKINMSKFLAQYLAELVKIAEDQSLNIEERELKVAKALQSFPGGNSADFACTPGTSQRILMAHQSLLPNNLHKRFAQETIDKNIQKFLPLIPLDCEIHLPNFLLSLVALEKISKILNMDPNIRFVGPNTKASDLYDFLLEFKTDDFSRKFDEKIDLICTEFENESKKLGLNTANLESISSGENIALFNFLKATAENIFVDQPIFAFKADFDYEFFFRSASKQEDRILLNKEQLKEKILQSYRDAHPTLFDQSKYDAFKYLPQKNELFSTSEEGVEFLDLNKIDNLVNLFEKINETDSEEERREKINKFNSGILILNSLSSNCSRIDNSYFLEFLEKIHDKEEQNFFLFLTNLVNDKFFIKPEYRTFENALLNLHQVFTKITQDFQLSENFRDVFVLDEPMKNLNEKIKLYKENKLDKNQINEIYYYAFQYARSDLIKELSQKTPELFKEQIFNSAINTRENFLHKILQNDDAESLKLLFNFVNKLEGEEKKIHQGYLKEMFKNSNFVKRLIDFKRVKLFELALDFTEIDFNEPTANNLHPIHIAINSKSYDVLELLLDHRKINKNINFLKQTQIGLEHLNILDYAMSQEETRAFKTILEKNCARELLTSTDENRPDSSFHNIISTDREELLNIFLSKVSCDDLNTLFASYSEQQNIIQGDNLFANLIFYKNKKNLFLIAKKYEKNGKLEEFMDLTLPDKFENVFVANLFLNDQSAENNLLKMLEPELFKNLIKKNSELISKLMVSEVIKTQAISDSTKDFFARPDGAQKRAKKANNLAIFTTLLEKLDEPIKSDLLENIYFEVKKGGEVNMKRSLAKILQQTRGMNAGQDTQHSWNEIPSLALTMLEEYLKSDLDSSQKQTKIEKLVFALNENELGEFIDIIKDLERFNEIEPNFSEKTKKLIKIYATKLGKFDISLIEDNLSGSDNELPTPPRNIKLSNLASSINLNESDNEFTKLCNEFLDSENPKIKKNQLKFIKDFMSIESAMDPEELKEQITNEYAPDDDRIKAEFRIKINEVISTFSITSSSPSPRLSERMSLDLSKQRT